MDKSYVEQRLIEIGLPVSEKGFEYITEAILTLNKPEWKNSKVTSVYYHVARVCDSSLASVERCIRHSFATARSVRNEKKEKYLGYDYIQNKSTLYRLAGLLSLEYQIV